MNRVNTHTLTPENLHFGAQLCHAVMLWQIVGEESVATAVWTLPAEGTLGQVSLQPSPLYLHGATWEDISTET